MVLGKNRSGSLADRINLAGGHEFPIYNSMYLGEDKLVLRYQLQLFVDKTWKNFHFNPYFIAVAGFLSSDNQKLLQAKMNTKFGLGILFYNPYLAFNRFQVSLVYYPKLPFDTTGGFEVNQYRNYEMPINTFYANQPEVAGYY